GSAHAEQRQRRTAARRAGRDGGRTAVGGDGRRRLPRVGGRKRRRAGPGRHRRAGHACGADCRRGHTAGPGPPAAGGNGPQRPGEGAAAVYAGTLHRRISPVVCRAGGGGSMAGIGFELKRLYRKEGVLAQLRAHAYAISVAVGPMLLAMAQILALLALMTVNGASLMERELFLATALYAFIFSLLLTGGLTMVLSRFLADRLFHRDYVHLSS